MVLDASVVPHRVTRHTHVMNHTDFEEGQVTLQVEQTV